MQERTVAYKYAASADDVFRLFIDATFLRRRAEQSGECNVEVEVHEAEDGTRVVLSRDMSVEVPAVVRRLLQPTQNVREEALWRRDESGLSASFMVRVRDVPGEVMGELKLQDCPEGCTYEACFRVNSWLPFVSTRLERLVADRVEDVMHKMLEGIEFALPSNQVARAG